MRVRPSTVFRTTLRVARFLAAAALVLCLSPVSAAFAQPAPPGGLAATDHPWDNGTRIDLRWTLSADDSRLQGYVVSAKADTETAFAPVDVVSRGSSTFTVSNLVPQRSYLFQVKAVGPDGTESAPATTATPIAPTVDWFDGTRIWFL